MLDACPSMARVVGGPTMQLDAAPIVAFGTSAAKPLKIKLPTDVLINDGERNFATTVATTTTSNTASRVVTNLAGKCVFLSAVLATNANSRYLFCLHAFVFVRSILICRSTTENTVRRIEGQMPC